MDWTKLLFAYLHDPPDGVSETRDTETHVAQYMGALLGRPVPLDEFHGIGCMGTSVAGFLEPLPMPSPEALEGLGARREKKQLEVFHPISGSCSAIDRVTTDVTGICGAYASLADSQGDAYARFLRVWRLAQHRLVCLDTGFDRLPSDARNPDHTIWRHFDVTAGLHAALSGEGGAAFLSFSLGPVQPFISAARTVRDLWSGSAILSWLTFNAMLPIVESCGPTALISPALRGSPLMDLWLKKQVSDWPADSGLLDKAGVPCLPHRFLAVVPSGRDGTEALVLARKCELAASEAWGSLADKVWTEINQTIRKLPGAVDWDRFWDQQIQTYFEFRTSVLPFQDWDDNTCARMSGKEKFEQAFPQAALVRTLADAIRPEDRPRCPQKDVGRWQSLVAMAARLMDAHRMVRSVPPSAAETETAGQFPAKCSLFGSYEQMGPAGLDESRKFWEAAREGLTVQGVRLRAEERLCAVALVKRFAVVTHLRNEFHLGKEDVHYADTATVAAVEWLKNAGIDSAKVRRKYDKWSGQWVHWPSSDFDPDEDPVPDEVWQRIKEQRKEEKPPAYYAVLKMDGDHMGKWLRGDKGPKVRDVLHTDVKDYFDRIPAAKDGLDAQRPVSPALHAAISEALSNFAVHIVPKIIEEHSGTLIYAGGDDVLALLPTRTALSCAAALRTAFQGKAGAGAPLGYYRDAETGRDLLVMGPKATLSAGLAVVHYKEDLRQALDAARQAEQRAKEKGRDALELAICRRSGEHSSARCPWEWAEELAALVNAFVNGASDRWAYHLRGELPTLRGMHQEAIHAEIRRQVGRTEESTRSLLLPDRPKEAGEHWAGQFDKYCSQRKTAPQGEKVTSGELLDDFTILCQSASFLARGRER